MLNEARPASAPLSREDGYAPIEEYAAIGDGRTVALVARDGSIDWWCLPDLDSPSVFGALLDAERGGSFRLAPSLPFDVERRYRSGSNVLETTFHTERGSARVTDAMTLPLAGLSPTRELARSIEGLAGSVPMNWSAEPRFGYASEETRLERRGSVAVATGGAPAVAFCSWSAGEPRIEEASIASNFTIEEGESALLLASVAHGDPLVFPSREEAERRLWATSAYWEAWSEDRQYEGPWRDAVIRSALALKLLIFAPSGAIAAAATTSLPEALGEARNWDYRFTWIRDASASLDALLSLGCPHEGDAFFWWVLHASQLTHPRLDVLYRLDGRTSEPEAELELAGYRGSRPVRIGNGASKQTQLDVYGHLLQTAWLYAEAGGGLAGHTPAPRWHRGRRLRELAPTGFGNLGGAGRAPALHAVEDDVLGRARSRPAACRRRSHSPPERSPIGSARPPRFAVSSQIAAGRRGGAPTCASPAAEELDASLLLAIILGYGGSEEHDRLASTVECIRDELGSGDLLYRYRGEDGLAGEEGAFLACSFWLVEALARLGRREEAAELMEELLARSNDVGLYSEEIDPTSGRFLGNLPQGLVHLALINAAVTLAKEPADEYLGGAGRWVRGDAGADERAAAGDRVAGDADRLAVLARYRLYERPAPRPGLGLRPPLHRRTCLRHCLLRGLPSDRREQLVAGSAVRAAARGLRWDRACQRAAPTRASANGNDLHRRQQQPSARAARIPAAQLRNQHPAGDGGHPHHLRRDRR